MGLKQPLQHFDLETLAKNLKLNSIDVIKTTNMDIENIILNDLEDYLFSIKGRYELELKNEEIDTILESVMQVAKRRDHI